MAYFFWVDFWAPIIVPVSPRSMYFPQGLLNSLAMPHLGSGGLKWFLNSTQGSVRSSLPFAPFWKPGVLIAWVIGPLHRWAPKLDESA